MPAPEDVAAVEALLGRGVSADFEVVVRGRDDGPVVIRNAPLTFDGRPMPTRYWLVGAAERAAVSRLESAGGVAAAEAAVDPSALAAAHARYAAERDGALPAGHDGPAPSGGVGGTRRGVKCLHAHLAWYLAGGRDPVGRWVVDRLGAALSGAVAAFDLGTNSTRLLVLGPDGAVLDRLMRITGLGRGADAGAGDSAGGGAGGRLGKEAVERTLAALAEYRAVAEGRGAVRFRAAATAAVRGAVNGREFLDRAEAVLGSRPELLEGEEEGRLAYLGAASAMPAGTGPFLVVDVGGGSTELVAGAEPSEGADLDAVVSLPLGCVRVSESFLHGDPPTRSELAAARAHVAALLADALVAHPSLGRRRPVLGLAGTVAALCGLRLGLEPARWAELHGARLSRAEVDGLVAALAAEPLDRRRSRPELEPERAPVIVGGGIVLAGVLAALDADAVVHSTHDLLDGLAIELLHGSE